MSIEYQFTNSENWDLFWSESYNAVPTPNPVERFFPIGTVAPGITLSSNVIAIWCYNSQAEEHWRYGGRYFLKMGTGITVNGGTPNTVLKVGRIYLDQIEIIEIPNYSSTFSIEVDIPYWHRNFQLRIWEYTGNNQNTVQRKLDELIGNPLS